MENLKKDLWSREKLLLKFADIIFMVSIVLIAILRSMKIIGFSIIWFVGTLLYFYWFVSLCFFAKFENKEINKLKVKK